MVELKRRLEALKKLKNDYRKGGLRPDDICSLACAAMIANVRGLKEASFVGAAECEESSGPLPLASKLSISRLEFHEAETLVKKTPAGKPAGRSGTLSLLSLTSTVINVDRGYISAPKREKKRNSNDIEASSQKKASSKDDLSKYHREQIIAERAAADRPVGTSSAVICVPDGPIQEWVCSEMWLPEGFEFSKSKAKFSAHIFAMVLRTTNVTESSAVEDNGYFQEIVNICANALVTTWEKDLRKRARKQLSTEIEGKISELKELDVPELIAYVLDSIGKVAPGVSMYESLLMPCHNSALTSLSIYIMKY